MSQATCGFFGVLYALHGPFGTETAVPGTWCFPAFSCDSGGGGKKDEGSQRNSAVDYFSASDDVTDESQTKEGMPLTPLDPQNVTYSRVQGGTPPNASRYRIYVNADGSISIPNKSADLNVSVGTEHAGYFQAIRGENSEIVRFDLPKWFHDFINESAIKQFGYGSNPLNQGGTVPKIVDPTTPGLSYEFPPPWIKWIEEYATNGRVIK